MSEKLKIKKKKKSKLAFTNPPKRSRSAQRHYDKAYRADVRGLGDGTGSLYGTGKKLKKLGKALAPSGQLPLSKKDRPYTSDKKNMFVTKEEYKEFLKKHHSPSVKQKREFEAVKKFLKKKKKK